MSANSATEARKQAVALAASRKPRVFDPPRDAQGRVRITAEYGARTFDLRKMKEKLAEPVYEKLLACIERQQPLHESIAADVAHAAKEWAIENGATHYCHWFQPLTGLTAEKHDSFLKLDGGNPLERFSGSELIQSEPDASSFPSGGMRTTFEARGYTAWDPASPMFLMGGATGWTMCIPSAYLSYHGQSLDQKAGLLRSNEAVDRAIRKLFAALKLPAPARVTSTVGAEQEYFLVDRAMVALRPDLMLAGRTVLGAASPKGQQLDDHYFGSISPRVQAFMNEFEHELYQLGVPVKTRHNEVAPGQYESAPIFEESNVAADHNQLTMEVMRRIAKRHNFEVFFHEKPFAGINGTGKHLNWSLAAKRVDGGWDNLFEPGATPETNERFLLMTAATLRAVHRHAGVLRASISGSGNDHRLGANEAPPAIISVFLGSTLTGIFERLAEGIAGADDARASFLSLGISHLPNVARDNTDRNRTSPFAFTGNKWEFRACGGSMSASFPITALNAAMAQALNEISAALEAKTAAGDSVEAAILAVLHEVAAETLAIHFEGDNYSDAWVAEAESRGLPNLRKTPDALAWLADPQRHAFLVEQEVHSSEEVQARVHVSTERYIKCVDIECNVLTRLVDTMVLPAAAEYFGMLCRTVADAKSIGQEAPQAGRAGEIGDLLGRLTASATRLTELKQSIDGSGAEESQIASRYGTELLPAMDAVRVVADGLETLCGDAWWPLPSYQEMLFVR